MSKDVLQDKTQIQQKKLELQHSLLDISEYISSIEFIKIGLNDSYCDEELAQILCDQNSVYWQDILNAKFPIQDLEHIKKMIIDGIEEGWFSPYEGKDLTYGRLCKAEHNKNVSIETVVMTSTGPGHVHPMCEFDLCFALDGEPTFDGCKEGWVVYPPTSWHVPTVTGGTMAILYFLPEGVIQFQKHPLTSMEERRNLLQNM